MIAHKALTAKCTRTGAEGTATFCLRLPKGGHSLTAHYAATSASLASQSAPKTVTTR